MSVAAVRRVALARCFVRSMGYVPFNRHALERNTSPPTNVGADGIGEKTPAMSRARMVVPIASDSALADRYVTVFGGVRVGRLLEDIDAFGAGIAYNHCNGFDEARRLTVVTASFDRISLLNPLRTGLDVQLAGQVTYVGSSSMEIHVTVSSIDADGQALPVGLDCKTTMVAREAYAPRSARIHRLVPQTPEEKRAFVQGKANADRRRVHMLETLTDKPPTSEEVGIVHDLFKLRRNASLSSFNFLSLEQTRLSTTKLMHPEARNIHNNVFGGIIMMHGFELAYAACNLFFGDKPQLVAIDEVHFLHPVAIGSIVRMDAIVCYKEQSRVIVRVEVRVIDPSSGNSNVTNYVWVTFHTYSGRRLPDLMPVSYEEAILMLEGRRKMKLL